ncbi:MAG TPA: hypothetical protein PKD16_02075 [Saprospiraceae bacterium]|jgi:hypothetical protein|nr:hypothetical protein [Saprospiraceae bacterium]
MSRLEWNEVGKRFFETGVSHGVLYPRSGPGVAWSGITAVNEAISGGEVQSLYFDGVKYLDIVANEDFQATLEAFNSPKEFAACDGSKTLSPGLFATQQPRKTFGLSYRTLIGNDLDGLDYGYKLHIVYNCVASPAGRTNQTVAGNPTPGVRSWTLNAVPPEASTYKPTAHFVIDSTQVNRFMLEDLETYLYGRDGFEPALPSQEEVIAFLANVIEEPLGDFI